MRVHSVAEWERLMTPANFGRLRAVDAARRTGAAVYLEG